MSEASVPPKHMRWVRQPCAFSGCMSSDFREPVSRCCVGGRGGSCSGSQLLRSASSRLSCSPVGTILAVSCLAYFFAWCGFHLESVAFPLALDKVFFFSFGETGRSTPCGTDRWFGGVAESRDLPQSIAGARSREIHALDPHGRCLEESFKSWDNFYQE